MPPWGATYPELWVEDGVIVPPDGVEVGDLVLGGRVQVLLQLLQRGLRPVLRLTSIYRLGGKEVDPFLTPPRCLGREGGREGFIIPQVRGRMNPYLAELKPKLLYLDTCQTSERFHQLSPTRGLH